MWVQWYCFDGQNVLQEFRESTSYGTTTLSPTATYLAGPRGVEYRQDESTGKRSWYLYDGLGSVIGEIDEGNQDQGTPPQITATRTYDVYGAPLAGSDEGTTRHKFCGGLGHTADADTGLTYMRARYYEPAIGRFVSEDPAEQGVNWHVYCEGNPIGLIDPDGRGPMSTLGSSQVLSAVVPGLIWAMYFIEVALNLIQNGDPGMPPGAGGFASPILNPEKQPGPPPTPAGAGSKLENGLDRWRDSVQFVVDATSWIIERYTDDALSPR